MTSLANQTHDHILRDQLVQMLTVQQAHISLDHMVQHFPEAHINTKPNNLDYSFWHLLEHIRICQADILDYIRNPSYEVPDFPDDYWPDKRQDTDLAGWQKTIAEFNRDLAALVAMLRDPATDLYAQIPHAQAGHNILREVLIVADHNAYHIGEFAILRQTLDLW